jgi:hypothetical protein
LGKAVRNKLVSLLKDVLVPAEHPDFQPLAEVARAEADFVLAVRLHRSLAAEDALCGPVHAHFVVIVSNVLPIYDRTVAVEIVGVDEDRQGNVTPQQHPVRLPLREEEQAGEAAQEQEEEDEAE